MTPEDTARSGIAGDLTRLGLPRGGVVMVHASLSALGHVPGGAETVVDALIEALGPDGTLVMPAFLESASLPGLHDQLPGEIEAEVRALAVPDPATAPTTTGAIPEAFRRRPGVRRSAHPTTSITALGPAAEAILAPHPDPWATGRESPFARLVEMDAALLLLGVGFNRLTLLHYAETLLPQGRRKTRGLLHQGRVLAVPDTGDDLNTHFPEIGRRAITSGIARTGPVAAGTGTLSTSRAVNDLAMAYLADVLPDPAARNA